MIERLDSELGAAAVPVPADGNCMAWSMRYFLKERVESSRTDFKTKKAKEEMMRVRKMAQSVWENVAHDALWQNLFGNCCQDIPANAPSTPTNEPKDPVPATAPDETLATPPRVAKKAKIEQGVSRLDAAKPASFGKATAVPKDAALKAPGQKAVEDVLEPSVPNLEDEISRMHEAVPKPETDEAIVAFAGPDLDEVPDDSRIATRPRFSRSAHERQWKSKPISKKMVEKAAFEKMLGTHQITYANWQACHSQRATLKKARVCTDAGFARMKTNLREGILPHCQACVDLLQFHDVTLEKVQYVISNCGEPPEAPGKRGEQGADPGKGKRENGYTACVEYVKDHGLGEVELITEGTAEKPILKYRCTLCRTKHQPKGKLNHLGPPVLKNVEYFVQRHLNCPTHLAKREKRTSGAVPTYQPAKIPCPGCSDLFHLILFYFDIF